MVLAGILSLSQNLCGMGIGTYFKENIENDSAGNNPFCYKTPGVKQLHTGLQREYKPIPQTMRIKDEYHSSSIGHPNFSNPTVLENLDPIHGLYSSKQDDETDDDGQLYHLNNKKSLSAIESLWPNLTEFEPFKQIESRTSSYEHSIPTTKFQLIDNEGTANLQSSRDSLCGVAGQDEKTPYFLSTTSKRPSPAVDQTDDPQVIIISGSPTPIYQHTNQKKPGR